MKKTLLFVLLFISANIWAQAPEEITVSDINHHGFTLKFTTTKEVGISLNVKNETTAQRSTTELSALSKEHTLEVNGLEPGCIYETYLNYNNGESYGPYYYGTRSASTGVIKVYFNHEVDTSKAIKGNYATVLDKSIDDTIISYINKATETLDLALYNIQTTSSISSFKNALDNAYAKGVKIRIVYDSTNTYAQDFMAALNHSIGRMYRYGKPTDDIMHNKFMIIDANVSDASKSWVWTGSINWTSQQLNSDRNHGIAIQDQTLAKAYTLEFIEMFGSAGLYPGIATAKFGDKKGDNTVHKFNIGGRDVYSYFSPTDNVTRKICGVIDSANSDCSAAVMTFTRDDMRISLNNRFNAGVKGTHVLIDDGSSTSEYIALKDVLGASRVYSWTQGYIMHHKFVVTDNFLRSSDPTVATGSHNWTTNAETGNDENTLIIKDSLIANQFYQAFYKMYTQNGGVIGIRETMLSANLDAFPNPAKDKIKISFDEEERNEAASYIITDISGRVIDVGKKAKTAGELDINLSAYNTGVYFVKIDSEKGSSLIKVIKE